LLAERIEVAMNLRVVAAIEPTEFGFIQRERGSRVEDPPQNVGPRVEGSQREARSVLPAVGNNPLPCRG
jgi:hypothetical protein